MRVVLSNAKNLALELNFDGVSVMKRTMILLALGCLLSSFAQGLAQTKTHAGFEKLKSLVGVWEGKRSDGRAVKVTYELISAVAS